MQQQLLFDAPRLPPHNAAPTSKAAAHAIAPVAGTQRAAILSAIRAAGVRGITDDELQATLGLDGSTIRPRSGELLAAGLIEKTNNTRPTRSGRQAAVYRVKGIQ